MNVVKVFPSVPFRILTLSFFYRGRYVYILLRRYMMQCLGRIPRVSAYSLVFLTFSCIYSFRLFNTDYLKGNYLGNHAMCVSHAVRISYDLLASSIRIAITAALLLILFWTTRMMMILNEKPPSYASSGKILPGELCPNEILVDGKEVNFN